jgi:outer membrane protein TolC
MEASYLSVKTQIVDTRRNIQSVENALCKLLAVAPQHISRQRWGTTTLHHADAQGDGEQRMFDSKYLHLGFPAMMLEKRPDIRMANYAMEEAFYNTAAARSAFFPSITLSGSAGWTNNAGVIVDPGKLLLTAVASLTQPIFARGKLIANKKIAKLTEEDLQKKYIQTVINAGNQVNEAMADCMAAREKHGYYSRQVAVLHEAYIGTHELMDNGKASYLEVLKAQESLLDAQLASAMNMYDAAEAVIALYIALGGGL